MAVQNGELVPIDCTLTRLNAINRGIFERMGRPLNLAGYRGPYAHPFFLSRTQLEHAQYSAASIDVHLKRLRVSHADYRRHGLFVLRSTVMNPHYILAAAGRHDAATEKDYLFDFVRQLHAITRDVLR